MRRVSVVMGIVLGAFLVVTAAGVDAGSGYLSGSSHEEEAIVSEFTEPEYLEQAIETGEVSEEAAESSEYATEEAVETGAFHEGNPVPEGTMIEERSESSPELFLP